MTKYREILRLASLNLSQTNIALMGSVHKEATTEHQNNEIDSQQTMYSPKK